ncbi:hypothetical protein [Deinococcus sp. S9]|uniref:hypothetical protein n=1 Tax=Deinococcus sp. S9 TaxID=2545754 RepID=UPI001054E378|nr:hypothetical protein [Deinococcus sp. S9]TDE85294.1 hypothetical protein E0686_12805 [Deinococcus sp. S9]
MDTAEINPAARRLRAALRLQGVTGPDDISLEEILRRGGGRGLLGTQPDPLTALDAALRGQGVTLERNALMAVAWAVLGVPAPRTVRLGSAAAVRLTHLAELHDLMLPSTVQTLARRLAGEANLAPDLLRVRPWLTGLTKLEDVLAAVFRDEWSGFLALLGEFGPWVYVPSVADLQALSHRYAALVRAASTSGENAVLAAAWQLQQLGASPPLLARLEVSDHRREAGHQETSELVRLERAFWTAAEQQASRRRNERAARRG